MITRVTALKDFLATALSTSQNGTAFDLGGVASGEKLYSALHLTQGFNSTARVLVAKVQSASSSGFAAPADRATFALSTAVGSSWAPPASGFSTDHRFWRSDFTMSTGPSNSTGGSWKGLVEMGIR